MRDGGGFEREVVMKVAEVGLDRDVGGDEWEGWCRVGVGG